MEASGGAGKEGKLRKDGAAGTRMGAPLDGRMGQGPLAALSPGERTATGPAAEITAGD